MNYKTAVTYANWERIGEPFTRNRKLYTTVKGKCDRCNKGIYVSRVENGQPIPHPAYGGVCLKCGGEGFIQKQVRLYTEAEFVNIEKAKEQACLNRKKAYVDKANEITQKWLERNGFNQNQITYVYYPKDSFDKKEELKEHGFKFNSELLWHCASPKDFENMTIEVKLKDIADITENGYIHFKDDAKDIVRELLKKVRPKVSSEWIGEEKERIIGLKVKLTDIHEFEGYYGTSQIVRFETGNGDIIKWFTNVNIPFEIGDIFFLDGTVKKLVEDKYEDDAKVTMMTRCKMYSTAF